MAELKHICGKTCLKCDCAGWDEDLLHRFLNGLADQKAWHQIEFVKDVGAT